MTSEHVRRAIILLFLFNLALLAQNWRTSERIDEMNATATSTLKAVNDAKDTYQKGNDRIDKAVERLDAMTQNTKKSK